MGRGPRDKKAAVSQMSPVSRRVSSSLSIIDGSHLESKIKKALSELVVNAGLKVRRGRKHEINATFESSESGYRIWLEKESAIALKEASILESDAHFVEALKTINTLQKKVAKRHALSPEERKSLEKFANQFFYGSSAPESDDEIIRFPRDALREYSWHNRYEEYKRAELLGIFENKDDYKEYQDFDEGLSGFRSGEDRVELDRMLLQSLQFGVAAGLAADLHEVGEEAVGVDIAETEQDELNNLGNKIENLRRSKVDYADQLKGISASLDSRSLTFNTHGDKAKRRKNHAKDIKDSGVIAFMDEIDPLFGENICSLL
jgi:hypothetical protein